MWLPVCQGYNTHTHTNTHNDKEWEGGKERDPEHPRPRILSSQLLYDNKACYHWLNVHSMLKEILYNIWVVFFIREFITLCVLKCNLKKLCILKYYTTKPGHVLCKCDPCLERSTGVQLLCSYVKSVWTFICSVRQNNVFLKTYIVYGILCESVNQIASVHCAL